MCRRLKVSARMYVCSVTFSCAAAGNRSHLREYPRQNPANSAAAPAGTDPHSGSVPPSTSARAVKFRGLHPQTTDPPAAASLFSVPDTAAKCSAAPRGAGRNRHEGFYPSASARRRADNTFRPDFSAHPPCNRGCSRCGCRGRAGNSGFSPHSPRATFFP